MTLKNWFEDHPEVIQKEFASRIGVTREYLNYLINKRRRSSPRVASLIERETGGEVKAMEILYPEPVEAATK